MYLAGLQKLEKEALKIVLQFCKKLTIELCRIQQSHSGCVSKGEKIGSSKTLLHSQVHCSTIHNNQVMETIQESTDR
jgi:hypothetical protein